VAVAVTPGGEPAVHHESAHGRREPAEDHNREDGGEDEDQSDHANRLEQRGKSSTWLLHGCPVLGALMILNAGGCQLDTVRSGHLFGKAA